MCFPLLQVQVCFLWLCTNGRSERHLYTFFPSCSIVTLLVFPLGIWCHRREVTFFPSSFPCLFSSLLSLRYSHYELSTHLGLMLRECIRQSAIHARILSAPSLLDPLISIHSFSRHFHVSCDVLSILTDLFLQNSSLVSSLLLSGEPLFRYVLVCFRTDFAVLCMDAAFD